MSSSSSTSSRNNGRDRDDRNDRDRRVQVSEETKQAHANRLEKIGQRDGVYVPPHLRRQQQQTSSPEAFQRERWEVLRRSINGLINKLNIDNIDRIAVEIFRQNLVRGRGLFCRAIISSQAAALTFSNVYASLVAIVNSKIPSIGKLLAVRLLTIFTRSYRRNDRVSCSASVLFLAHLVNQRVIHEVLVLEILLLLLDKPTNDSVSLAIDILKACGATLSELAPSLLSDAFGVLRDVYQSGKVDARAGALIEQLMSIRKRDWDGYEAIPSGLDLVEDEDKVTHELDLNEKYDVETKLDVFTYDPQWQANEDEYEAVKRAIIGDDEEVEVEEGEKGEGDANGSMEDGEGRERDGIDEEQDGSSGSGSSSGGAVPLTDTELIDLRRRIYLTIQSTLNYEEAVHKLLQQGLGSNGRERELASMIVECCSNEKTYLKNYGSMAQRLCEIDVKYRDEFEDLFALHYATAHRYITGKLRNMARFYAHLLATDAIGWEVLSYIRLTQEDTNSASRIFIRVLFEDLAQTMGLHSLLTRLRHPALQESLVGVFPKDHPKHTAFAIDFFTAIGLGGLTQDLRDHREALKREMLAKMSMGALGGGGGAGTGILDARKAAEFAAAAMADSDSDSDSDSSSSSSSSSDSSDSDSSSSDSDSDSNSSHGYSSSSDDDSDSSSSEDSESEDDRRSRRKRRNSPRERKPRVSRSSPSPARGKERGSTRERDREGVKKEDVISERQSKDVIKSEPTTSVNGATEDAKEGSKKNEREPASSMVKLEPTSSSSSSSSSRDGERRRDRSLDSGRYDRRDRSRDRQRGDRREDREDRGRRDERSSRDSRRERDDRDEYRVKREEPRERDSDRTRDRERERERGRDDVDRDDKARESDRKRRRSDSPGRDRDGLRYRSSRRSPSRSPSPSAKRRRHD